MVESLHWWEMRESHPLDLERTGFTDLRVYFITLISHNKWWGGTGFAPAKLISYS